MKKILLGLLITALVLGLTSCAPESYKEMAEKMGKMSENVYGITANMADVDNATATVSNSVTVTVNPDTGVATADIKFNDAAKIMDSVAKVKDSEQKTEALKEELAKPVVDTSSMSETEAAAQNKAVKDAMEAQTAALTTAVEQKKSEAVAAGATEEQIAILDTVLDTITSVQNSISDEPTMAELSTIAVLTEMATTVQEVAAAAVDPTQQDKYVTEEGLTEEGLKVADTALSSLDTLKMTSEVAGMNLLGDVDIMDLMTSLTGGSKGIDPKVQPYLVAFKAPVATITSLITTEGKFDGKKYDSIVAQAKAIKMSYDLLSALYVTPETILDIDAVLSKKMNHGLVVDDLVRYILALTFVSIDKANGKEALGQFIDAGDGAVYAALMDIGNEEKVAAFNDVNVDGFGTIWTNIQASFMNVTENGPVLSQYALRSLSTLAILIVDTGYKDILKQEGNEEGLVSVYFSKLLTPAEAN